jgi:hypothetical protein
VSRLSYLDAWAALVLRVGPATLAGLRAEAGLTGEKAV